LRLERWGFIILDRIPGKLHLSATASKVSLPE